MGEGAEFQYVKSGGRQTGYELLTNLWHTLIGLVIHQFNKSLVSAYYSWSYPSERDRLEVPTLRCLHSSKHVHIEGYSGDIK